jgi:hypothetical protein
VTRESSNDYLSKHPLRVQCSANAKSTGKRCTRPAIWGGKVCPVHGGAAPQVKARAAVNAELARWGAGDTTLDPGMVLLRLVTQSANRAEFYAGLLEEQYVAAAEGAETASLPAKVGELIGYKYALAKDGTAVPIEEAIRGLVQLEGQERDRCGTFAAKAVAAGLMERQIKMAEKQGEFLAEFMRAILDDPELGLTEAQRKAAPGVARRILSVAR